MKKIFICVLVCFSIPSAGQTLTYGQVYDYSPGDVFQWTYTDYGPIGNPNCYYYAINTYHTDSIISKYYSVLNDTVFYSMFSTAYTPVQCNPTLPPKYTSVTQTVHFTNLNFVVVTDTFMLSCLPPSDTLYISNIYCGKKIWQDHSNFSIDTPYCFEQPYWKNTFIEGCGSYTEYRGGYGGEPHYSTQLTYYKKSNTTCGTRNTVGINEGKIDKEISIYPNPNDGTMNFIYSIKGNGQLIIYNISGSEISKYFLPQGENKIFINEKKLNNGIYFYKMIVDDELKANGKITIIK